MPSSATRADPVDRRAAPEGTPLRLYGVVPASLRVAAGLPDDLALVPHRSIAALTRPAPSGRPRDLRAYLLGYAEILDRLAVPGPVLPVRFGTTLPSRTQLVDQVLAPGHDAFQRTLTALAGKAQFMVRARYHEPVLIREVLARRPEVARLHRQLSHLRDGTADPRRLRLGELVAQGVAAAREADLDLLVREVSRYAVAAAVRPAPGVPGERLGDVAFLVELARSDEFEAAVADLAQHWRERVRLRLLGPMAAYDFVADAVDGAAIGRGARWDC